MAYGIAKTRAGGLAHRAADAGDPALLDQLPDPRLRLDRAAAEQRLINNLLLAIGVIDQPLVLLHTNFAVYLGIVYSYLPFMVLPLYATLVRMDMTLLEAAADLGCRPGRPSSPSPCRCRCPGSSPARCWCSSLPWASS
jgi:hypothetical protein